MTCAVAGQGGEKLKNQLGHPLHGQIRRGHKPLYPSITAIGEGRIVKSGGQLGIIDRLYLA